MEVYLITDSGVKPVPAQELQDLLRRPDALIWVDIPRCDGRTALVLSETFGFHDIAIFDCLERNHISKLHVYDDHVFTVLHAPEIGSQGHVHYVELDQFLGPNYLVTVHGPLNPVVDPEVAFLDTGQVLRRIENGHLHPRTPFELSSAIVSALTRREIDLIATLAKQSGDLERQLMLGAVSHDPEPFLEELFKTWYELLAIRTIAVHSAATYDRMAKLVRSLPETERPLVADIADRFHQVSSMADGQREFLHGVIEFFQTRTSTHMTIAAEALSGTSVQQNDDMRRITAWVAIVAVPTAVRLLRPKHPLPRPAVLAVHRCGRSVPPKSEGIPDDQVGHTDLTHPHAEPSNGEPPCPLPLKSAEVHFNPARWWCVPLQLARIEGPSDASCDFGPARPQVRRRFIDTDPYRASQKRLDRTSPRANQTYPPRSAR